MNNSEFRKLLAGSSNQQNGSATPGPSATPARAGALGTKKSSFVPMTPRSVGSGSGVDFARQVRERNAGMQPAQAKKFKSYQPKGTKLGAGYTDRAKARATGEGNEDAEDKAERVKALEEQMKLGQISNEMFEALRDKIIGDDAASSHLVKGLDRKLLERVRRGEDVLGLGTAKTSEEEPTGQVDFDEELDKMGEKEVQALKKEKTEKKGTMAPPPPLAGKKRTRDEIMAEIKAQRQAAAEAKLAAEPKLSDRWTKTTDAKKPKFEIDEKGREVMITVDENGKVKKRVRKVKSAPMDQTAKTMDAPDPSKPVLGADVAIPGSTDSKGKETKLEDDDDDDFDMFEGVGTDYNPLAGMLNDDGSDDSDDSDTERPQKKSAPTETQPSSADAAEGEAVFKAPSVTEQEVPARRNYFNDTTPTTRETQEDRMAGIRDVLKKAAKMEALASADQDDEESRKAREAQAAQAKKRAQMLANEDRDMEDMDMGFGGSRLDDGADDDEDDMKVKLREWKGGAAGDDGWEEEDGNGGGKGREKKKRKPKKRKGDASSMADIMGVIEGRKSNEKK